MLIPREGTRYAVRDKKVKGLDVRVMPKGDGRKIWTLRFRAAGEQRRMKLGLYPQMSLAEARQQAEMVLSRVRQGSDPRADQRAARVAALDAKRTAALEARSTVEALCAAYIEQHAKPHKRTWRDDQSKIASEILPQWGRRQVAAITRRDCDLLVRAIAARPAPIYANRVAALLQRLFRFAVDEYLVPVNVATKLRKPGIEFSSRSEEHREVKPYSKDEIRVLWAATEPLAAAPRALYRLGLITGQRPSEIAGMGWAEISVEKDEHWWTIPASRTKNKRVHRVFLSALALDTLSQIPRMGDEPRVFAGWRGKRQLAALNAVVFSRVRARSKPRHAMRDTVATGLAACRVAVNDVSHVLNHSVGLRVTQGYQAYRFDAEKRVALETWDRELRRILTGQDDQADPGAVVPFTGRRR
jgi:integrase